MMIQFFLAERAIKSNIAQTAKESLANKFGGINRAEEPAAVHIDRYRARERQYFRYGNRYY